MNNGMNLEPLIPIVAIVGGLGIAALAIIGGLIKSNSQRRQFEESRREIAAYVAEGSMTPEEGERLLKAESKSMKNA
jgi:hypothetical protein